MIKYTSCLPRVGGSLWLPPPLKLVAINKILQRINYLLLKAFPLDCQSVSVAPFEAVLFRLSKFLLEALNTRIILIYVFERVIVV